MHEASITDSIINSVLETLDKENVHGKVTAVSLTTGVCQGLIPESMQMFFDMAKHGTRLENAELLINSQKMVAHCSDCDCDHELDGPVLFCPNCGSPMELIKGNEIIITSIEVDDE
jgi:hydrogenase nickel incorporation protein HypA/HybF